MGLIMGVNENIGFWRDFNGFGTQRNLQIEL